MREMFDSIYEEDDELWARVMRDVCAPLPFDGAVDRTVNLAVRATYGCSGHVFNSTDCSSSDLYNRACAVVRLFQDPAVGEAALAVARLDEADSFVSDKLGLFADQLLKDL